MTSIMTMEMEIYKNYYYYQQIRLKKKEQNIVVFLIFFIEETKSIKEYHFLVIETNALKTNK